MLAYLERDVFEHRQVGEQPTHLELHPHLAPQLIQSIAAQLVHDLAVDLDVAIGRNKLAADQAQ